MNLPKRSSELPRVPETRSAASILLAAFAIGAPLLVAGIILATRQRFLHTVDEFELDVPPFTRLVTGPLLPAFLVVVGGVTFFKEFLGLAPRVRTGWNAVALILGAASLAVYVAGVFESLISLMDALAS